MKYTREQCVNILQTVAYWGDRDKAPIIFSLAEMLAERLAPQPTEVTDAMVERMARYEYEREEGSGTWPIFNDDEMLPFLQWSRAALTAALTEPEA